MTRNLPVTLSSVRRCVAVAALLSAGCGKIQYQVAGGSTDTGNTIVAVSGEVLDPSGGRAEKADLSLRPAGYLSPLPALGKRGAYLFDTVTDTLGAFVLKGLDTGAYRLEAREGNGLATLFDFHAAPGKGAQELPEQRLAKTAKVSGTALLRPQAQRGFVQVYGMERLISVNTATGRFDLILPAGKFTLRLIDPEGGTQGIKLKDVTLAAGDSVDIGSIALRDSSDTLPKPTADSAYAAWAHSRGIALNTTASGADVAQNVYGFPLLLRLDSSYLDFSQTAANGADLRFSTSDGKTALAYEIERWDASAKQAVVWVRMDTVFGGRSDQAILMHWGNAKVTDSSDGAAVFDTALGFSGVWHLKEASNAPGFPGYVDATANRGTGKGQGISDTTAGPGLIGWGQRLDGNGAYIHVPNAAALNFGAGDFCVSAWAKADIVADHNHQLLSKRADPGGVYEMQTQSDGHMYGYVGGSGSTADNPSRAAVKAGEWHWYALRRGGGTTALWIDGQIDTVITNTDYDVDSPSDLYIGHDGGLGEDWQGTVDETRAMKKAMAPEWLLLDYRSQMPGSKLVSPGKP